MYKYFYFVDIDELCWEEILQIDTWWTNWNDLEMGLFEIIFYLTFFYDFEMFTCLFSECVENVILFSECLESCLRCG